jgi:hypothetical protein
VSHVTPLPSRWGPLPPAADTPIRGKGPSHTRAVSNSNSNSSASAENLLLIPCAKLLRHIWHTCQTQRRASGASTWACTGDCTTGCKRCKSCRTSGGDCNHRHACCCAAKLPASHRRRYTPLPLPNTAQQHQIAPSMWHVAEPGRPPSSAVLPPWHFPAPSNTPCRVDCVWLARTAAQGSCRPSLGRDIEMCLPRAMVHS